MLKKYGGQVRQRELATRAQDAGNVILEQNRSLPRMFQRLKLHLRSELMTQVIGIGGEYRNRTGSHGFATPQPPPTRRRDRFVKCDPWFRRSGALQRFKGRPFRPCDGFGRP
jgi:hypothetical protein